LNTKFVSQLVYRLYDKIHSLELHVTHPSLRDIKLFIMKQRDYLSSNTYDGEVIEIERIFNLSESRENYCCPHDPKAVVLEVIDKGATNITGKAMRLERIFKESFSKAVSGSRSGDFNIYSFFDKQTSTNVYMRSYIDAYIEVNRTNRTNCSLLKLTSTELTCISNPNVSLIHIRPNLFLNMKLMRYLQKEKVPIASAVKQTINKFKKRIIFGSIAFLILLVFVLLMVATCKRMYEDILDDNDKKPSEINININKKSVDASLNKKVSSRKEPQTKNLVKVQVKRKK
jgi:hypothetical protein